MHPQTAAVLLTIPDTAPFPPACIHSPDGVSLCDACQGEWEADPEAYLEFGQHTAGIANWEALKAEMAARPTHPILDIDESVPADEGNVLPW